MVNVPYILVRMVLISNLIINLSPGTDLTVDQEVLSASTPRITLSPPPAPSKVPTAIPTPTPTQTPKPTYPASTSTPTPQPQRATSTDTEENFIMGEINAYRTSQGLVAFETHPIVCDFAQTRANELQSDFSHTKFRQRIDSGALPYPSYSRVAENNANTSSYKDVFDMWKNSSGHNKNVLSNAKYACVGHSGRYYSLQFWTP